VLAQKLCELGASTREPLANGLGSQTEDRRDLDWLQTLDADEQRDLAMRGWERRKRALERRLRLRVDERFERRAIGCSMRSVVIAGQITGEQRPDLLRARPAHDEPVCDREQPGIEAGVLGERARVLGEPQERLL
jgi:hypothetical protein